MTATHEVPRFAGVGVNREKSQLSSREILFGAIYNFRDLGGHLAADGRHVAWGRVFRSGELLHATEDDLLRLDSEIGLHSILDLRNAKDLSLFGTGSIATKGFRYFNVPLITDPDNTLITLEYLISWSQVRALHGSPAGSGFISQPILRL
jgi:hypothetical protein